LSGSLQAVPLALAQKSPAQPLPAATKSIATARTASKLKHLADLGALTLSLDVTAPDAEIEKVVAEALKTYGYIDILFHMRTRYWRERSRKSGLSLHSIETEQGLRRY
jgi:hypothetical protein